MFHRPSARRTYKVLPALVLLLAMNSSPLYAQMAPTVIVNWEKKTPNHTTPTLQAVVNPMLRRGSPIHDASFAALHRLGCDYVRYAFWFPYPKLVVAELQPPDKGARPFGISNTLIHWLRTS